MNHPRTFNQSPTTRPQRISTRQAICCLFLSAAVLLIVSGCGRSRTAQNSSPTVAEQASEESTATSVVILASTPTFTPPAVTPQADTPSDSENGIAETNTGDGSDQSVDSDESTSANENLSSELSSASSDTESEESLSCDEDIALDLVGHPEYENLLGELGCPIGSAKLEPVAINEFGQGPDYDRFMLWFSSNLQIYVLKPDQTWAAFQDTWIEGEEDEILCNPLGGEMTSPPLPRRGFGKLWCLEGDFKTVMGPIEREERLCQHTVLQEFEKGLLLGCFEDATIRYIQIFNDSSWDMKFVQ